MTPRRLLTAARPSAAGLAAALGLLLLLAPASLSQEANHTAGEDGHEHRVLEPGEEVDRQLVAIVAAGAAIAMFAGGMLVLAGKRISELRIHLLLGITGGLLLSIAFVDLLPAALEADHDARWTMALALLGLLALHLVLGDRHGHEHTQPSDGAAPASHHETSPAHSGQLAIIAFLALAFHRLVDGIVLPAAFAADTSAGLAAAGGVLLHQVPGGVAGASLFVAAGWSKLDVAKGLAGLAIITPIGAGLGLFLTGIAGILGHLIGLAAATFVFVALAELLPELESPRYRWVVAGGFVIGYGLLVLLQVATRAF